MANQDPIAAKVTSTVGRILTDPHFADQIRTDGLAAIKAGAGSAEWTKYFDHFAPTPGALQALGHANSANCTCNSATWVTLSSIVTPIPTCCGATTTTTTSG